MPLTLAVMLLTRDMARCAVLGAINPGPFAFRHDPIGLRLIFHLIDMFLLLVQAIRFPLVQLTAGNPLIDPLFLIGLPLVNDWGFSLSKDDSI